jgi:hypothetical protein
MPQNSGSGASCGLIGGGVCDKRTHREESAETSSWLPFLWTLAILCAAYVPLFFGKILFFRDIAHWTFPARAFLRETLAAGEFPAWNPYQGLGFPVFGDPLYGVFYPPNWLFLLVRPGWVASMLNWQCFLHLAWGAAGVCWLARRLGASAKANIVAGLAWALSGYTTAQWTSGLLLFAGAWVPWAAAGHVVLVDRLAAGRNWRRGVVLASLPSIFAVLLGEVFLAMIGAGFGLVFAYLVSGVERRADSNLPRARLSWVARSALAVMLAFGVGGIVIVPARMLLGASERATALPRDLAEACSLHPMRVAEFVAPQAMGDAYGEFPAASVVGEARLDGLPLSYSVYMGTAVVALALAAFGRRRRIATAVGTLAGFALLLALGKYTPVHGIFRRIVVPLAYMRYPEKYMVLVVLALALLAALGAQRVLGEERQPWRRTAMLLGLVLGFGVAARLALPPAWAVFAIHGAMIGGLALVGMLAVHLLVARHSPLGPLLLVAVVAFDLAAAAWPLQGFGPRSIASEPPPAARVALELSPEHAAPPRLYRSNQTNDTVNRWVPANSNADGEFRLTQTLVTNTANAWGIATLPGYDAAIPARVGEVWDRGLAIGQSALRLLGADWAVLPVADPGAPKNDRPGLEPVLDPLPGARLYRVSGALPRVFLARHAEVLDDAQALARIYEPDIVAGKSVWLAPEAGARELAQPAGRSGACSLESYGRSRLVALCAASEPAIAVFVEQFDRGWRATVDGRATPILRANLLMRALPLKPGQHRITMEYHTPGLVAGGTISAMGVLLLALLLV